MSTQRTAEDYLKNRVSDQIDWYDRKARILKKRYRWMKGFTIALGVLIPVMISINDLMQGMGSYVAAIFGAAISALEGISGMLKDKDTMISYRSAREALMREQMLFTALAGNYANNENAFQSFVVNCETIMGSENDLWRDRLNQEPKTEE